MNIHLSLWAKYPEKESPYPLVCHLLDSATAAQAIWQHWLRKGLQNQIVAELGDKAQKIFMLLAGLHDLGKANPVFQLQEASAKKENWQPVFREKLKSLGYNVNKIRGNHAKYDAIRRHERVTAYHLAKQLFLGDQKAVKFPASLISLGHHGFFSWNDRESEWYERYATGQWLNVREDILRYISNSVELSIEDIPDISPTVQILLSGLVILADRIASQDVALEEAARLQKERMLDPEKGKQWIKQRAPFFVNSVKQLLGVYQDFSDAKSAIFGEYQLNDPQLKSTELQDGLWLIKTATGSGKTELAMKRHAEQNEPVTFLLPTQATTNAMMRRLQQMYQETPNVAALAHGDAWLTDFYNQNITVFKDTDTHGNETEKQEEGLFPSHFVASRSERLLAPVTVGTIDQALMASFPLKWTHLRLLALANSHIIIDEAHTLDPYQTRLLRPLLWWLGRTKTRVTLLSATLPSGHRDEFVNAYTEGKANLKTPVVFPSLTSVSADGERKSEINDLETRQYKINLELVETDDSVNSHIMWATESLAQYPRARLGIVVNTIKKAQEIGSALSELNIKVLVLHSRMTLAHRQKVAQQLENLIGKKGQAERFVVVGTQTIEASLDIDLDMMSTDWAPAPSIIQRAGRVWRHFPSTRHERIPGIQALPLQIVKDTSPVGNLPYLSWQLENSWDFLKHKNALYSPRDIQEFIETSWFTFEKFEVALAQLAKKKVSQEKIEQFEKMALEEAANASVKIMEATSKYSNLKQILTTEARFSDFGSLTNFEVRVDDFPSTRFIEYDSIRVVFTDLDPKLVPGGWSGTKTEINSIAKKDVASIKSALEGSISVSGKILEQVKETTSLIEDVPLMSGIRTGEIPDGLVYDSLLGLKEV